MSNIRVFVQWTEQTVFAGEDIECQITFRNVATLPESGRGNGHGHSYNGRLNGATSGIDRARKAPVHAPASQPRSNTSFRPGPPNRGHRSTMSLNLASNGTNSDQGCDSWKDTLNKPKSDERGTHRRSVSIISLNHSESAVENNSSNNVKPPTPRRPSRGHNRAASLQILPRRGAPNGASGPPSAPLAHRSTTHPSPLFISSKSSDEDRTQTGSPRLSTKQSLDSSQQKYASNGSPSFGEGFRFPAIISPADQSVSTGAVGEDGSVNPFIEKLLSPRPRDSVPSILEQTTPAARILSPVNHGDTPRSSGEFYSLSNNSTETLASEYLPQQSTRMPLRGGHSRRISTLAPLNQQRTVETLMMGYAQIAGSFTVDGSLVSQAPFEEVKRKGVVGGQGGGVIGVETSKRDSGMLRGFGWGNIGESLSGFLGGGELSSIKEMRGTVSSKSIPLLSTPQSILFVDLKLAPGESRSYKYSFKLPRGLPPSHRGKAIKIAYNLVIGTQRPGGAKEQQVKSVEVPFRVLGSVNCHGEILGHDLMSPYIILRDQARIQSIGPANTASKELRIQTLKSSKTDLDGFLAYVNELLDKPRQNSSLGLLSPTATSDHRRLSVVDEPATAREAIDIAILRSNMATEHQQSANRFEIARNGQRVAVIMLARPAYRLGETITAAIDFTDAQIPCYAIHASLETSEKVDPSIALRSDASIHRVTRKVHSSHSESSLFARRIVFTPNIPINASPSFITSSISFEWKILIEFVTPRLQETLGSRELPSTEILEEISRDERGVIRAAVERLDCESFEVAVPLIVYGAHADIERDIVSEGLLV